MVVAATAREMVAEVMEVDNMEEGWRAVAARAVEYRVGEEMALAA